MRVLRALWGLFGRWYVSVPLVIAAGLAVGYYAFFNVSQGKPQIGVIDIPFTVINDDSAFVIGEMIDFARESDSIKAVVVKLTTPGGGAAQSEELYHKLVVLREEKPVVVASGWLNASGGMMMTMGANYVYSEAASFIGSIGVVFGPIGEPRSPDERLFSSGPAKLTGASLRTFFTMSELLKESFIKIVTSERGDRLRIGPAELSEARLYVGIEAVQLGLVDEIGTDTDAVEKAASLAGISGYDLVDVNEKVFRQFVLQSRRIFASSDGPEPQFQMSDIAKLRGIASASLDGQGQDGFPTDFPTDTKLPRMYYLYVTPTE